MSDRRPIVWISESRARQAHRWNGRCRWSIAGLILSAVLPPVALVGSWIVILQLAMMALALAWWGFCLWNIRKLEKGHL